MKFVAFVDGTMPSKTLNLETDKIYISNSCIRQNGDKLRAHLYIASGSEMDLGVEKLGGKAYNLFRLKGAGFNVPEFFVLTTDAFKEVLSANPMSKSVDAYGTAEHDNLSSICFPAGLEKDILNAYRSTFGSGKVAVRSSATIEDMDEESMAGRFRTVLFADGTNIISAVKEVYSSLISDNEYNPNASMAVIIQKQVNSQTAGVAFVDRKRTIISAVIGQGEQLVSGKENGDTYVSNGKGYGTSIRLQNHMIMKNGKIEGIPPIIGARQKLLGYKIMEILEVSKKVMESFGGPQDIEWCIDGKDLFVLQSRPITKEVEVGNGFTSFSVIPVTHGKANGAPCFDVSNIPDRDVILAVPYIEIQDMERVIANRNVKGVITEFGGMLSHESIIAREKGIPYLSGFRSPREVLGDVKELVLDTTKPSLVADGKEVITSGSESYNWLNRDLTGLETIQIDNGYMEGVVVRRLGGFSIVYGDIKDTSQMEEFHRKLYGNDEESLILTDTQDRRLPFLHKVVVNSINLDDDVGNYVTPLMESVHKFDVEGFRTCYTNAVDALKARFADLVELYSNHKNDSQNGSLESLLVALTRINGLYKGIRVMPEYFEYALGSFISEHEGRTITDAELYKLADRYKSGFPAIMHMNKALERTITDVDKSIPLIGEGNSLDAIFESVLSEARKSMNHNRMYALLTGILRK